MSIVQGTQQAGELQMTSVRHQCLSRPCLPGTLGKVWVVTGNPTAGKVKSLIVNYTELNYFPSPALGRTQAAAGSGHPALGTALFCLLPACL